MSPQGREARAQRTQETGGRLMRIVYLMPGAGGAFHCENCLRDAGRIAGGIMDGDHRDVYLASSRVWLVRRARDGPRSTSSPISQPRSLAITGHFALSAKTMLLSAWLRVS